MKFAGAIWKLLVGIKDFMVLVLLLMFFGLLYAALNTRPAPVGSGVLAMRLDGRVVEQPARQDWADVVGGTAIRDHRLRDLVAALDAAKDDDRVKAVAIDVDGMMGGGQTAMSDLAEAVRTAVINKRAGGMGLISGRKAFQRPMKEGAGILNAIQDVYLSKQVTIA